MAYIEINKGKKIILGSNSPRRKQLLQDCLLYTSDAADEL